MRAVRPRRAVNGESHSKIRAVEALCARLHLSVDCFRADVAATTSLAIFSSVIIRRKQMERTLFHLSKCQDHKDRKKVLQALVGRVLERNVCSLNPSDTNHSYKWCYTQEVESTQPWRGSLKSWVMCNCHATWHANITELRNIGSVDCRLLCGLFSWLLEECVTVNALHKRKQNDWQKHQRPLFFLSRKIRKKLLQIGPFI